MKIAINNYSQNKLKIIIIICTKGFKVLCGEGFKKETYLFTNEEDISKRIVKIKTLNPHFKTF